MTTDRSDELSTLQTTVLDALQRGLREPRELHHDARIRQACTDSRMRVDLCVYRALQSMRARGLVRICAFGSWASTDRGEALLQKGASSDNERAA